MCTCWIPGHAGYSLTSGRLKAVAKICPMGSPSLCNQLPVKTPDGLTSHLRSHSAARRESTVLAHRVALLQDLLRGSRQQDCGSWFASQGLSNDTPATTMPLDTQLGGCTGSRGQGPLHRAGLKILFRTYFLKRKMYNWNLDVPRDMTTLSLHLALLLIHAGKAQTALLMG